MVKKKDENNLEIAPYCKVCQHEHRAGIEMLAMLSCSSWAVCRERINNTFDTNFTENAIRKHMTQHEIHAASMESGVIIDGLRNNKNEVGVISAETIMETLALQGMMDLSKGKIRCKTPSELISVVNVLQNIKTRKDAQYAMETGDPSGFYAVMAAYGEAIRDTVSVSQMQEIIAKANSLGANFNIANTNIADVIEVEPIDYMQQAVDDYKTLGRTRTRDELIEAGVLDEIDEELGL